MDHQGLGLGGAEAQEGEGRSRVWAPVKPRMLSGHAQHSVRIHSAQFYRIN